MFGLGRNSKFNLKFSLRKRSAFEPKVVSGIHYLARQTGLKEAIFKITI